MSTAHPFARQPIEELYRWFASEAEPTSPTWARLCRWIADHREVSARLDALPGVKRQPNVFLAALKYLGGPVDPGPEFAAWVEARWPELERLIASRSTQTNEPGRCAVLAPVLASLPQPITLLEVGSSAGLCLLPDRYRYRWQTEDASEETRRDGDGPGDIALRARDDPGDDDLPADAAAESRPRDELLPPLLDCRVVGRPPGRIEDRIPDRLESRGAGRAPGRIEDLRIAARCGLDLNPLNPADPADVRWLRALVWPGEDAREARLAAALRLAASAPPEVIAGDLRTGLDILLDRIVPGTTGVLQHSAVLSYLPRAERDAFEAAVLASGVHWLSYEGPSVVTSVKNRLTDRADWAATPNFVVALDGLPLARAGAHGGWVHWYER